MPDYLESYKRIVLTIYEAESEFSLLFVKRNLLDRIRELMNSPRLMTPKNQGLSEAVVLLEIYSALLRAKFNDKLWLDDSEIKSWKSTILGVFDSYSIEEWEEGSDEPDYCHEKRKAIERLFGAIERDSTTPERLSQTKRDLLIKMEVVACYLDEWLQKENQGKIQLAISLLKRVLFNAYTETQNARNLNDMASLIRSSMFNDLDWDGAGFKEPNDGDELEWIATDFIRFAPGFISLLVDDRPYEHVLTISECNSKIKSLEERMKQLAVTNSLNPPL